MRVDGSDRDTCPVFQNPIQDNLCWDEHISFLQSFGQLIGGFDWDIDHRIQIPSRMRFAPSPFFDRTTIQIFDSSNFQSVLNQVGQLCIDQYR